MSSQLPLAVAVVADEIGRQEPELDRRQMVNRGYAAVAMYLIGQVSPEPEHLTGGSTQTLLIELGRAFYEIPPDDWLSLVADTELQMADGKTATQMVGRLRKRRRNSGSDEVASSK